MCVLKKKKSFLDNSNTLPPVFLPASTPHAHAPSLENH